jgi:hypothetical protein
MKLMPKAEHLGHFVDLAALDGPRYLITVDTEEEFDWSGPFTRDQHGTRHIAAIPEFQSLCEDHGARPAYLVDYPILEDPKAVDMLGGFACAGKADIGVQLHPWVNPPFDEIVNLTNSYACNLNRELEREKLRMLHVGIVEKFKLKPDIYRAGRYGAGAATPGILQELGISFDSSVRANFDYSDQEGPDYSDASLNPYWVAQGQLIELPLTTVFRGGLSALSAPVYFDMLASQTSRAVMARTGLLERISLTPEGVPLAKAIEGINAALLQNVGILNFSFHSPSLEPGHTSYVRNADELKAFYSWWYGVFAHLEKRGVKPVSVTELKNKFFG